MNFLGFKKNFEKYPVFSVRDIRKRYPGFDGRRLVEWQQKGYLLKINRGNYCFADRERGERFLYFAANKIYAPSYISLESAMAYYSLIPEGVFLTTSVTTKNTAKYSTGIGGFTYRHIKPDLFFGYRFLQENNFTIKIAKPEKAVLDFFYFNKTNNIAAVESMRFNTVLAKEIINTGLLEQYQKIFNSKILDKRIKLFLKIINA